MATGSEMTHCVPTSGNCLMSHCTAKNATPKLPFVAKGDNMSSVELDHDIGVVNELCRSTSELRLRVTDIARIVGL